MRNRFPTPLFIVSHKRFQNYLSKLIIGEQMIVANNLNVIWSYLFTLVHNRVFANFNIKQKKNEIK